MRGVGNRALFVFFVVIAFFLAFLFIRDKNLFVDEEVHYLQIQRFINGDYYIYDIITVIPGYHFFYALLGKVFSVYSISGIRLANAVIGMISVFVFLLLAMKIHGGKEGIAKGFQYAFFPILFPFFFLIYTDVLSLLLIFLMLYFILLKKYNIAGIFGILSFFVRQNNILWMAFVLGLVYVEKAGMKVELKNFLRVIKDCWSFILGFFMAIIFFIWNKGFVLGDKLMHEGGIYFGNVFFALFLFFFLFLPMNLGNFNKIKEFSRRNKWSWVVVLFIFLVYLWLFDVTHPYNFRGSDYFLRNVILQYFISGIVFKSLLFLPIAYSILSLCVVRFKRKEFYLLYIFAILSLLPLWLIEQRYYLIPFSLFILFKKEEKGWVEKLSILFYVVLSIWLVWGIGSVKFFL